MFDGRLGGVDLWFAILLSKNDDPLGGVLGMEEFEGIDDSFGFSLSFFPTRDNDDFPVHLEPINLLARGIQAVAGPSETRVLIEFG